MPSDVDRIKSSLASFIQRTLGAKIINRIDYLALYPCKVVVQNSDGTLDLIADDPRVGTPSGVPIRYGVPGISATVPAGSRCYLTFAAGDPRKPIVVDWEAGIALSLKLGSTGASHPLIFGDDFSGSGSGSAFDTLMQAIATAVGTSGSPAGATAAATAITTAITIYQTTVLSKLSAITKTS